MKRPRPKLPARGALAPPRAAASPTWARQDGDDVVMDVALIPQAARTRVMGVLDSHLKVHVSAPPVDGRANAALVEFLADALRIAKAQVSIMGGPQNRRKTVRLAQVQLSRVLLRLGPA